MARLSTNILTEEEIELMENKKITLEHVKKQCTTNGDPNKDYPIQIRFLTLTIGQAKTEEEETACYNRIAEIVNSDKDTWIELQKLRIKVNGSNMSCLIPEIPPLKYDNSAHGYHAIIDASSAEIELPFKMGEIFQLAKLFNSGWTAYKVNREYYVNGFYQFYHQDLINLDCIKRFERYFFKGALDDIIQRAFYFAKKEGFLDAGIEKIIFTTEKLEDYLPYRDDNL